MKRTTYPAALCALLLACAGANQSACAQASVAEPVPGIVHYAEGGTKFPFSMAVRAGDTIYLSGQIGADEHGLAKGFEAQARQAMDNVFGALKHLGLNGDNVVKCTILIGDMAKWSLFNDVYKSYFKPGHYPARSALGANGLALGAELEVECIAYAPAKP